MGLSAEQKYMFDLQGFVILRGVLGAEEVASANAAIDAHRSEFFERQEGIRNAKQATFAGEGGGDSAGSQYTGGRLECGSFLQWEDGDVFRSLLAHPNVAPKLNDLVGAGHRLDHMPLLLSQSAGVEGFDLHGGNISHSGAWNEELAYEYKHGRMVNNLLAVSVALTAVEGSMDQGGFVVAPGSHKSNLACPPSLQTLASAEDRRALLRCPAMAAGDAVLFSEGTMHGALPWAGPAERRFALFRFAPPTRGYGRGVYEAFDPAFLEALPPAQRSVLEPPYGLRLDRVTLGEEGEAQTAAQRDPRKTAFDRTIFQRGYF
jgi:hypothetical protein